MGSLRRPYGQPDVRFRRQYTINAAEDLHSYSDEVPFAFYTS